MNSIHVKSVQAHEQTLTVKFRCYGKIGKFFETKTFHAEYNVSIDHVSDGILVIPFLSSVLPVAWANHASVYVDELDFTFFEAMAEYKKSLQRMYPKLSLGGQLIVKHVSNDLGVVQSKNMMLFSGGVDALTTFMRHKNENLVLVCVHGGDINSNNQIGWKNAIEPIGEFAVSNDAVLRTVHSNFKNMIDSLTIRVFDDAIGQLCGWWSRVMHGLAYLGLCAPLAYAEGVKKLYIASSFTADYTGGWGSHPALDNTLRWAGTEVVHDGYELSRQEKLLFLFKHVQSSRLPITIRSCWSSETGENCSLCEKCSRTIVGLELAGLNPEALGFHIEADTFLKIKNNLSDGFWDIDDDWDDIKRYCHLKDQAIHVEARTLVDWLETVDLGSLRKRRFFRCNVTEPKQDIARRLNPLFMALPGPFYQVAKRCYWLAMFVFMRKTKS